MEARLISTVVSRNSPSLQAGFHMQMNKKILRIAIRPMQIPRRRLNAMPKTENKVHESGVANAQPVRRRRLRTKVLNVFSKVRTVFSKVLTEISIVLTVFRQLPGGEKDRPAGSRLPAFRRRKRSTGATAIATSARHRRDGPALPAHLAKCADAQPARRAGMESAHDQCPCRRSRRVRIPADATSRMTSTGRWTGT